MKRLCPDGNFETFKANLHKVPIDAMGIGLSADDVEAITNKIRLLSPSTTPMRSQAIATASQARTDFVPSTGTLP